MRGSLARTEIRSAALERNALGDSPRRTLLVYLPPGYDEGVARFPVAYFLHAFMGTGAGWTNVSPFALTVPERFDALIDRGEIPAMVGVFPDGATRLGGTQWNNSAAMGRYQDYVANDVVAFVDRTYRTIPNANARALLGRSSGGYGALLMGRDRPDVFGHIASNAGDAYFEYCYLPEFPKAAAVFEKVGGSQAWIRDFSERVYKTKMRGDDHVPLNVLAMSASYSPNAAAPMGFDLPFELGTGRLREDVFARWQEQDPARFAPARPEAFAKLKTVFLECGTRDEFNMRWGTRMVAEALKGKTHVVHEEFDDGHMGTSYRFDRALTVIGPRLGA